MRVSGLFLAASHVLQIRIASLHNSYAPIALQNSGWKEMTARMHGLH